MGFAIKKYIRFSKYKVLYLFVLLSFIPKIGEIKIILVLISIPYIAK